jgi:hypothetical protein
MPTAAAVPPYCINRFQRCSAPVFGAGPEGDCPSTSRQVAASARRRNIVTRGSGDLRSPPAARCYRSRSAISCGIRDPLPSICLLRTRPPPL